MKFRLICEEPDYIDFDEFRIVRWERGEYINFNYCIKTKDGKTHTPHDRYLKKHAKELHEMIVTISEPIDEPVESITVK